MKIGLASTFLPSFQRCFRPWWHPTNLWYSFKCWAWKRYSTVKPRYMPHTWCDKTELLLHMMFELLSEFVEKECSPGCVEWYGENGHKITVKGKEKYVRDEMQELYDWWHIKRRTRYEEIHEQLWDEIHMLDDRSLISNFRDGEDGVCYWDPQYSNEDDEKRVHDLMDRANRMERALENAEDRRLHRIINLRPYLWT